MARRLKSFAVLLTDRSPLTGGGPFNDTSRRTCAEHNEEMNSGQEVILTCANPLWGRYLVLDARVKKRFHLSEVEVFDGKLPWYNHVDDIILRNKLSCHC